MIKTLVNGIWVTDAIKDYSQGRQPAQPNLQAQIAKLTAQRDALATALRTVSDCKKITEVRKCLVHARAVYPK